MNLLIQIKSFS